MQSTFTRLVSVVTAGVALAVAGCTARPAEQRDATPVVRTSPLASPSQSEEPPATPAPAPAPTSPSEPTPKLKLKSGVVGAAVRKTSPSAVTAAVVLDREANKTLVSENGDRPFHSGSLVKLLIALDALTEGAGGQAMQRDIQRMVSASDDDIASRLWMQRGWTEIITRMSKKIGLNGTRPAADRGRWGDTWLTANDVVKIYQYILRSPATVRNVMISAMESAPQIAADGFQQHFGIPAATKQDWAIKQAWTNTDKDISVHSSGLVGEGRRYVVVLLTEHPHSQKFAVATKCVSAAAAIVAPLLSGEPN